MSVLEYLETCHTPYRTTEHRPVYSARQLARVEKVRPCQVAKPVVVEADSRLYLCVLPADRIIDFQALKHHLEAKRVALASEPQLKTIFSDVEVGAEAPIGGPYDLPVLMDKSLTRDREIVFLGGSHERSIWMNLDEYIRLVKPEILSFSLPDDWSFFGEQMHPYPFWPDSFF
jgi:Ala-tRNA(Pro) deacylase